MTDERKNKIWAMLSQEEKEGFQGMYELKGSYFDKGYNAALDEIFGSHNLTAQAEEKPPKGEENPKAKDFPILSDSLQASVDWNKYRLDLAKEIAVAMITRGEKPGLCSRAEKAVDMANEIVKRLKETEI